MTSALMFLLSALGLLALEPYIFTTNMVRVFPNYHVVNAIVVQAYTTGTIAQIYTTEDTFAFVNRPRRTINAFGGSGAYVDNMVKEKTGTKRVLGEKLYIANHTGSGPGAEISVEAFNAGTETISGAVYRKVDAGRAPGHLVENVIKTPNPACLAKVRAEDRSSARKKRAE